MNKVVNLNESEVIVISEDIENPDYYIDFFISKSAKDTENLTRLEAIKSLDHDLKVRWLLSLKPRLEPATTCTIIIVTTVVIVVIGYEIVDGVMKAITEKQEIQKEVEKCFE